MLQKTVLIKKCPKCGSKNNIIKIGFAWRKGKKIQRYNCKNCGYVFKND